MSETGQGTTSLSSVQTSLHALQTFTHSLEDEKNCIIDAGRQLAVALKEDDAAWETLERLNDIILPDIDRAIESAGELASHLFEYANMLIDTYEKTHREG